MFDGPRCSGDAMTAINRAISTRCPRIRNYNSSTEHALDTNETDCPPRKPPPEFQDPPMSMEPSAQCVLTGVAPRSVSLDMAIATLLLGPHSVCTATNPGTFPESGTRAFLTLQFLPVLLDDLPSVRRALSPIHVGREVAKAITLNRPSCMYFMYSSKRC